MVTTEKGVSAEDNVLSIDPFLITSTTVVIYEGIFEIDVTAPLSEGIRRYSGVVGVDSRTTRRLECLQNP